MDGSFGIIFSEDDSKVLLVKRRDIPIWVLPGGGIEFGETPQDAVIREVFEETGFKVEILKHVSIYTHKSGKVNHTFECKIIDGVETTSNESSEIDYFNFDGLPEMISPYVHRLIEDARSKNSDVLRKPAEETPKYLWIKALKHPWAFFKYLLTRVGIHWNT